MRRSLLAVGLLTVCLAGDAKGQSVVPARDTIQAKPRCFTGRPLPRCKTFWLTEVGSYRAMAGTEFTQQFEPSYSFKLPHLHDHLSWEVGVMANRNQRSAVGGTVLAGLERQGAARLGLKGRYRHWLGEQGMLDVSGGALRASMRLPHPEPPATAYGITGDVALGWRDWAAITVRGDALRGEGRTVSAVYGGVRLGSYPAIVATAVFAAYFALLMAAYSGGS